jgi:hypothetical protein
LDHPEGRSVFDRAARVKPLGFCVDFYVFELTPDTVYPDERGVPDTVQDGAYNGAFILFYCYLASPHFSSTTSFLLKVNNYKEQILYQLSASYKPGVHVTFLVFLTPIE